MVQTDPGNSNYTITSANKNHTGRYRCEAAVTAPGLSTYKTSYTVDVIVRCKSRLFIKLVFLVSFNAAVEASRFVSFLLILSFILLLCARYFCFLRISYFIFKL